MADMTPEEEEKIVKRARDLAEEHLRDNPDHDLMCDQSLRYGLGKALEEALGRPVNFSRDTSEPLMFELIDRIYFHYVAKVGPVE